MAIGGYGQLNIDSQGSCIHSDALKLQSARACLYLYLKDKNVDVLYLPSYLCDSIIPAIDSLGIVIKWYSIDESMLPHRIPDLDDNTYFLVVNYFGLLTKIIEDLLTNNQRNIIVDNSQALFASPFNCAANIYSPRKFLAIPDGGFMYSNVTFKSTLAKYDSSSHISHLMLRAVGKVREGYSHFLSAEKALEEFLPKKMSVISEYLIQTVDLKNIKIRRRENYIALSRVFKGINQFSFNLYDNDVPLCYPLKLNVDVSEICKRLAIQDIFLPRYWPNVNGIDENRWAQDIFDTTLFIPVDERIDQERMLRLIEQLSKEISDGGD